MCFYLTVSLTSPAFRFSFPLQMILTWGKRLIHTLFHMFRSFPITLFNWLKSSQGGSLTAVLFWILQTTQLLPSFPTKTSSHSCRLAAPFCCGLFHIACVPTQKGFRRAAARILPLSMQVEPPQYCQCRGEDKPLSSSHLPLWNASVLHPLLGCRSGLPAPPPYCTMPSANFFFLVWPCHLSSPWSTGCKWNYEVPGWHLSFRLGIAISSLASWSMRSSTKSTSFLRQTHTQRAVVFSGDFLHLRFLKSVSLKSDYCAAHMQAS